MPACLPQRCGSPAKPGSHSIPTRRHVLGDWAGCLADAGLLIDGGSCRARMWALGTLAVPLNCVLNAKCRGLGETSPILSPSGAASQGADLPRRNETSTDHDLWLFLISGHQSMARPWLWAQKLASDPEGADLPDSGLELRAPP